MSQPFKDAIALCKTMMRNGYDAYVINARLQQVTLDDKEGATSIDISTEMGFDEIKRHFPTVQACTDAQAMAVLHEGKTSYVFFPADADDASHPEETVTRLTPRLLKALEAQGDIPMSSACPWIPKVADTYDGFEDFASGEVRFAGIPDQTLKRNYVLALRALRFAANFNLPIEANTWMAIVRGARRVLDYVSVSDIMDEWRKVEAENMWLFAQRLFDSQILHGLVPELAALSRVIQLKGPEAGEETVLAHTIEVMRRYPEELPYDWYGTLACFFHDVGKLYTAEWYDDQWNFLQHHRVGAKVTRKILNRLRFPQEDVDLVCLLVQNHMRPHFMLTDKGVRKLKALDEYPRIMEMVRADIKARDGSYREFNHNLKMLERADIPEDEIEPLLNGNQIMKATGLKPGPTVGVMRDALLKAQIAGDVQNVDDAKKFVKRYKDREQLH